MIRSLNCGWVLIESSSGTETIGAAVFSLGVAKSLSELRISLILKFDTLVGGLSRIGTGLSRFFSTKTFSDGTVVEGLDSSVVIILVTGFS